MIGSARFWLVISSILCMAVYWPGLSGPFLFDDPENFAPLRAWLDGQVSWQAAVLGDQPLWLSRPLAMITFLASAAVGQGDAFHFKLGNLLIHIACGWLLFAVLVRLLKHDHRLRAHASFAAAALAILWLLHPLHASTVLYAVQRMAQLSALFTLLSLLAYLSGRAALTTGSGGRAAALLFLAFPLAVIAGLLCKQNAATAPLLCLVVEAAYFQRSPRDRKVLGAFFSLFVGLPALSAVVLLATRPAALLAGYAEYDFTLVERLLTQPRALFDYVGQIILPRGPLMGLYTDDFAASSSLLSPPATWIALAALCLVSVLAFAIRKRAPSVFAGWFFFLAAHLVESSFLPLDLYFEHRNYLPMVGLLLMAAGLVSLLPQNLVTNVMTPRQLLLMATVAAVLGLTFSTLGRSLVWSEKQAIVLQGVKVHPNSLRARLDLTALAQNYGRTDIYEEQMALLKQSDDRRARMLGHLYTVSMACHQGTGGDPADIKAALSNAGDKITPAETLAYRAVLGNSAKQGCGDVSDSLIADSMARLLEETPMQADSARNKWIFRGMTAEAFLRANDTSNAVKHARLAWESGAGPGVGTMLAGALLQRGEWEEARRVLIKLGTTTPCHDLRAVARIRSLSEAMHQASSLAGDNDGGVTAVATCRGG
ncbi:MAG TPA: hypothetical protein VM469_04040 [Pseudoxanthomonas sp.]|nr:hypothetical protein [Pseudoxanthomonas sp.]